MPVHSVLVDSAETSEVLIGVVLTLGVQVECITDVTTDVVEWVDTQVFVPEV
jgi:hypothetical protein